MKRLIAIGMLLAAACTQQKEAAAPAASTTTAAPSSAAAGSGASPVSSDTLPGSDLKRGSELAVRKFKTLDGESFTLDSLRGKAVLVNIWATWCVPCREEMPDLARLAASMKGKPFELVGISVDDAESHEKVKEFVSELAIDYPIVVDPDSELLSALNTPVLPTTVLLDRQGKAQWLKMGPIRHDDPKLLEALQSAMR